MDVGYFIFLSDLGREEIVKNKMEYYGITHGKTTDGEVNRHKGCKEGIHLFDEVSSSWNHYLICDKCGMVITLTSVMKGVIQLHTKVLLRYLDKARKCGGFYSPGYKGGHGYSMEMLKAELATREHVPNKVEAKKIRQEKAKGRK